MYSQFNLRRETETDAEANCKYLVQRQQQLHNTITPRYRHLTQKTERERSKENNSRARSFMPCTQFEIRKKGYTRRLSALAVFDLSLHFF